jgi:putative restriction endonuclease
MDHILQQFQRLSTWSRGDQRAPHKPLVVLLALARWQQGQRSALPFADIEPDLTALLKEFGPTRQSFHPEYPFWRLRNDGVWMVQSDQPMKPRASNNDVLKSE